MVLDPLAVARKVTQVFDTLGLRYSIGGSMASAFAGEPRMTLDVDIVADLQQHYLDPLIAQLGDEFHIDAEALGRAISAAL
jgi:hypothetical protein